MRTIIRYTIFLLPIFIIQLQYTQPALANTVVEDFTGATTTNPWLHLGDACLTAGSNAPSSNASSPIPACPSPYTDTANNGALLLTPNENHQTGAIISPTPFPADQGVQITFTTYTFGGTGADGIGFYLMKAVGADGTKYPAPTKTGAVGGSLGYTCTNDPSNVNSTNTGGWDGLANAYLGLEIDEFGNASNCHDNTNTGYNPKSGTCPYYNGPVSSSSSSSPFSLSYGKMTPGEVVVRGAGNMTFGALNSLNSNYYPSTLPFTSTNNKSQQFAVNSSCATGTLWNLSGNKPVNTNNPLPSYMNYGLIGRYPISNFPANSSITDRTDATPMNYRLTVTADGKLSLAYSVGKAGTYSTLINQQSITNNNGTPPQAYYFGFGGSTGGSNNFHEITCFEASPSTRSTSSPIAPVSVSGSSLIYSISSNPDPVAGHVQAFKTVATPTSSASAPIGTATGTYLWDAGDPIDPPYMSKSTRLGALYSTGPTPTGSPMGSGSVPLLSALDTAAFNLSTTNPPSCVPDIATIINYTIDPNYSSGSCSYLAGRQAGWMLGGINPNDSARYLGPPGNAALLALPGYVNFARLNNKRPPQLLFTSDDGFLYSVDATKGSLTWGWMPRPFVSNLQNYAGFEALGSFNGGFTVTDAVSQSPSPNTWNTYVVGTAQSGAYHYSLQLTTAPLPKAQAWGIGTCPAGATCSSPQMQAPVIATVNGNQYAIFIVNALTTSTNNKGVTTKSTTSTLYEVNVATGASTTGTALPFTANSAITYVPSTGTLWIGDAAGKIWSLNVSGSASSDAGSAISEATTSPAAPINYVGYTEINGIAYMWAATSTQISTFRLSGATGSLIWSSTGGSTPSSSASGVNTLQLNGTISAAPAFVNGVLIVPVYVPPTSSCALVGTGYYDLFDLLSGGLPKIPITYKNNAITNGVVDLGQGIPYTPSVSVTNSGTVVYPGNSLPPSSQNPISPINFGGSVMNKPIAWRQY